MRREIKKEDEVNIKVGLLTLLGILLIFILFIWRSGLLLKVQGYELVGRFENVSGLLVTSPVQYRGYKVGTVEQINPKASQIEVVAKLSQELSLPADSYLRIDYDGLVGQKFLSIMPGESSKLLVPGTVLKGYSTAGMSDFIHEGSGSMAEARKLLMNFNRSFSKDNPDASFAKIMHDFEEITKSLNKTMPKLEKAVNNLDTMLAELVNNKENINKTLVDTQASAHNLLEFSGKLNQTISKNAENIDVIIYEVKRASKRLNKVLRTKN